jgi:hypothetical protein
MRSSSARLILAAAGSLAALATAASATQPSIESGLESAGKPVSDAALGEMRGMFIRPENISYFGVQMQTSWQGADGVTTAANLLFKVDFAAGAGNSNGATPVLLIGWTREGDPSLDVAGFSEAASRSYVALPGQQLPIGGLAGSQGAVQTQQIAGSDNRVRNDMQIAIVPASSIQAAGQQPGMVPVSSDGSRTSSAGHSLNVTVSDNALGISMTNSNSEQVRQSFDGSVGQLAQHVLLSSDGNSVHQQMGVVVGYDQVSQASKLSLENTLSSVNFSGF